ncbi:unnamed protein product [Calypogeia fissa]
METSTEPLVVFQTNHHGCGVVVGLAVEQYRVGNVCTEEGTNFNSARPTGEMLNESGTESTSRTATSSTAWADLRTRLRRSRRSTFQPSLLVVPRSMTIDRLVAFLVEEESPKTQEQAAKKLAELSAIDEHRSTIAKSQQALANLARILSVDNPNLRYHAAVALGNLAATEENLKIFIQFPDALTGLVSLLFQCHELLVQHGAAMALANLSLWKEGGKLILDTPQSIKGLVGLAMVVPNGSGGQNCGHDEAKRALLNLALLRENKPILDCPISLPALAGFLSPYNKDNLEQEDAVKALANLSYTKENAKKIAESSQFPLFLAALVRFLLHRCPATGTTGASRASSGNGLEARKLAAIALANLSITDSTQRMVAEFPNALTGLFTCLRLQYEGERVLSLQLKECAAMAIGNLALAKENRRKIVHFGGTEGLSDLTTLLFQDDNPGGQEYAAWSMANLSHHNTYDSEDIAIKIGNSPNVVKGLVRLLQLPTPESDFQQPGSCRSRIGVQEQALRALANLTFPHDSQVRIARVPNVVKALAAALLSRRCSQNRSPMIQEHAARALANLTSAKENWMSAEIFDDAIRALVDVLSVDNVEASPKTWKCGAIALGNFALSLSHHKAIVECKQAMTGLVRMLFRGDYPVVGKEQAAWTLANLANGDFSTKAAIASFPFAVTGLLGLLSDREDSKVQDQARRALVGLRSVGLDDFVSRIAVASASCDVAGSSSHSPFSMFELSSRPEACI